MPRAHKKKKGRATDSNSAPSVRSERSPSNSNSSPKGVLRLLTFTAGMNLLGSGEASCEDRRDVAQQYLEKLGIGPTSGKSGNEVEAELVEVVEPSSSQEAGYNFTPRKRTRITSSFSPAKSSSLDCSQYIDFNPSEDKQAAYKEHEEHERAQKQAENPIATLREEEEEDEAQEENEAEKETEEEEVKEEKGYSKPGTSKMGRGTKRRAISAPKRSDPAFAGIARPNGWPEETGRRARTRQTRQSSEGEKEKEDTKMRLRPRAADEGGKGKKRS